MHDLDVVGIGNAIVDVIAHADDAFLDGHGMVKGSMQLIDADAAHALYADMGTGDRDVRRLGRQHHGRHRLASAARSPSSARWPTTSSARCSPTTSAPSACTFEHAPAPIGVATARCLIVVTPDAQRTMNTYLGVSALLGPDDVDETLVARAAGRLLRGLPLGPPDAKDALPQGAWTRPTTPGGKVSFTLSDSFCVDRHRAEFLELVEPQVDILFANEAEICSLYEVDDVRRGARSAVRRPLRDRLPHPQREGLGRHRPASEIHVIDVPTRSTDVVDTTGAGDLYAAGFLYGHTHGYSLADCGRLGSLAAAEVISHVGARPLTSLRRLAATAGIEGSPRI